MQGSHSYRLISSTTVDRLAQCPRRITLGSQRNGKTWHILLLQHGESTHWVIFWIKSAQRIVCVCNPEKIYVYNINISTNNILYLVSPALVSSIFPQISINHIIYEIIVCLLSPLLQRGWGSSSAHSKPQPSVRVGSMDQWMVVHHEKVTCFTVKLETILSGDINLLSLEHDS